MRHNDTIKSKIPLFLGLLELTDIILFIPVCPPSCLALLFWRYVCLSKSIVGGVSISNKNL